MKRENSDDSEVAKLRRQVAELQAQSAAQKSYRDYSRETASPQVFPKTDTGIDARRAQPMANRPRLDIVSDAERMAIWLLPAIMLQTPQKLRKSSIS